MPKRTRRPKGNAHVQVAAQLERRQAKIHILPEDVLLEIFDLYVAPVPRDDELRSREAWCTLVQVCRKWRNLVLESPLRLNLRIRCHPTTPVRDKLDTWPTLPIIIAQYHDDWHPTWGTENIIAALNHNDRISEINLCSVPGPEMGEILAAMHKSFPILKDLWLESFDETVSVDPVDPDLFLGGSAPCLRSLHLVSIPFPGLSKLLFSATLLTDLQLINISDSGYISPEVMVSCFSALTRLETLILEFESPESSEFDFSDSSEFEISESSESESPESSSVREQRRPPPPPPTRTLLPALTQLEFYGVSEYLEDLVVRIDTPLLDDLRISLFHQFVPDNAQITQFIKHAPRLKAHNEVHVAFHVSHVVLRFQRLLEKGMQFSYEVVDQPVSSVAQVFTSSLSQAFSATVEHLYICDHYALWRGDIQVENNHWLELLRPFTSVKSLYLSEVIVPRIAPALQELIGERVAGGVPSLQTLFLEDVNLSGAVQEAIGSFVTGRKLSGHPVAVSHWERKWSD